MNATNLLLATIAANFFQATAEKPNNSLSPSIVKEFNAGNIELQPAGLMHATQFTEGNSVEILQSSNNRSNGKSDFSGQKLDANMVFLITGMRVGYVESTETNPAAVAYDSDRDNLPAAFVNSILEIHQGGKLKIRIPVSRLLTQVNADSQSGDIYQLPGLVILNGDTETNIKLLMPEGAEIGATNNDFFRIDFEGFATRTRS